MTTKIVVGGVTMNIHPGVSITVSQSFGAAVIVDVSPVVQPMMGASKSYEIGHDKAPSPREDTGGITKKGL